MRLCSFDLSLAHAGWATYKDRHEDWGVIDSPKGDGDYADLERLKYIVTTLGEIARGSDLAVVEGFAFARPEQSHQLGALGYMMRIWLWSHQIPFVTVAPAALKKWASGSGKCKKDLILREVNRRWQVVIDDDNAADAYALLKLGEALVNLHDWELTEFQRAVLKVIEKNQKHRYEQLL